jgi:hypothetical protein
MTKNIKALILCSGVLTMATLAVSVQAGVTEADGLGSSWLGSPNFMTVASPTAGASAENNYNGGNGITGSAGGLGGLGQSFVNTSAGTLNNIQLSMGGAAGFQFTIALYDLGSATGYAPATSASFNPGSLTDLFSPSLSYTFGGGSGGAQSVVQLTFSGADAVSLSANEVYAFTMEPTTAGTQPSWYRGGATAFAGGQAFRDGQFAANQYGAINGGIRDFDMAVTLASVPEPGSIAMLGMGTLALAGLIRRFKK